MHDAKGEQSFNESCSCHFGGGKTRPDNQGEHPKEIVFRGKMIKVNDQPKNRALFPLKSESYVELNVATFFVVAGYFNLLLPKQIWPRNLRNANEILSGQ